MVLEAHTSAHLKLPGKIFLAPMAGFTDTAFRTICIRRGAALVFTEMVSAEALVRKSEKTYKLLKRGDEESYWGIQLFGSDPDVLGRATALVSNFNPTIIDLNCGCSVPKVLKTGSGAALLKYPDRLYSIISAMKQNTEIPISIKIRSGWNSESINYLEIGETAQKAGVSLITIHPRTRTQGFSGRADWSQIEILKKHLEIPVTGSGDIFLYSDIEKMLEQTNADAVMVARGAIGNPFIFEKNLKGRSPDYNEIFKTALEHVKLAVKYKGEKSGCKDLRKHITAYSKGFPGSAEFRKNIIQASTFEDYKTIIEEYVMKLSKAV
ncbi:MAG: tRNA dihydrouridine synthase DusB [Spirochaetes bacterium]|nr:MAG: tRNA dihydrouridine synthase DusB [Spirochaetota bacterium]